MKVFIDGEWKELTNKELRELTTTRNHLAPKEEETKEEETNECESCML